MKLFVQFVKRGFRRKAVASREWGSSEGILPLKMFLSLLPQPPTLLDNKKSDKLPNYERAVLIYEYVFFVMFYFLCVLEFKCGLLSTSLP